MNKELSKILSLTLTLAILAPSASSLTENTFLKGLLGSSTAYAATIDYSNYNLASKTIDDATQAVVNAEASIVSEDLAIARTAVTGLSDQTEIDALTYRLDRVQDKLAGAQGLSVLPDGYTDATFKTYFNGISSKTGWITGINYYTASKFHFTKNGVTAYYWQVTFNFNAPNYTYLPETSKFYMIQNADGTLQVVVGSDVNGKVGAYDGSGGWGHTITAKDGLLMGTGENNYYTTSYLRAYDLFSKKSFATPVTSWGTAYTTHQGITSNLNYVTNKYAFFSVYDDNKVTTNYRLDRNTMALITTTPLYYDNTYYPSTYLGGSRVLSYINGSLTVRNEASNLALITSIPISSGPSYYDFSIYPGFVAVGAGVNSKVIDLDTLTVNTVLTSEYASVYVAAAAVATAQSQMTQASVNSARTLVNALTNLSAKATYSAQLDVVQAKIDAQVAQLPAATAAVVTVEATLISTDLTTAQGLVTALPINNSDKTGLQTRLSTASTNVTRANDARTKVSALEASQTVANYTAAKTAIDLLPVGQVKTDLQTRLNTIGSSLVIAGDVTAPTATVNAMAYVGSGDTIVPQVTVTPGVDNAAVGSPLPASGVARTQYRVNSGDWVDYTGAFALSVYGTVKLETKTVDNAGNSSAITTSSLTVTDYSVVIGQIQSNLSLIAGTNSLTLYNSTLAQINALPASTIKTTLTTQISALTQAVANATDIAAPTAPTLAFSSTTGLMTLTNGVDGQPAGTLASGVSKSQYSLNGGAWVDYSTPFNLGGAYGTVSVVARTIDKAGNISALATSGLSVLQDKTAPNPPSIALGTDDKTITLTPGTDVYSIDGGGTTNITEGFESATPVLTATGNWFRTTATPADGSYDLRSAVIGNSASSSETFSFAVPAGPNATLSFKYKVSSEANYDFLTVLVDGVQQARVSGNGGWVDFSKSLAAGNHTIQFTYSKDSSATANSDAAYVDVISIKSNGVVIPPSGVSKMQYMIENDGTWIDYNAAFVPNKGGLITVSAREIDNAGNISTVTSKQVTIKNDVLQQAQQDITAVEALVADLSTQAKVDTAKSQLASVVAELPQIQDGPDKIALQTRIDTVNIAINVAQATINATSAVADIASSLTGLDVQSAVTSAQAKIDIAQGLVSSLPASTVKTELQGRIDTAQQTVTAAQAIIDATNAVGNIESSLTGLDSQSAIGTVQSALNTAEGLVTSLPASTIKTDLQARLDVAQQSLYVAQATLNVAYVESFDLASATHDQVVDYQGSKDIVSAYVNDKLTDGAVKTDLTSRLDVVQSKIDIAIATLQATAAENAITQSAVDSAITIIATLPDGAVKTELQTRVDTVQSVVNAETQVVTAQGTLDSVTTSLEGSDLWVSGKEQQSIVDLTQAQLDSLSAQNDKAISQVDSLKTNGKQALTDKANELKQQLSKISGCADSIQQIINELSKNPKQAKGKHKETTLDAHFNRKDDSTKIELKAKGLTGDEKKFTIDGESIDVASIFKDTIEATIGTGNYHWIAIDKDLSTVSKTGVVTPVKDGVAKITVFNENGIVNIYVQQGGVPKASK